MKNKLFLTFVALFFVTQTWGQQTGRYDFVVDGIYYNIILKGKENKVEVTNKGSYNTYSGTVVIPSTVENDGVTYTVAKIGLNAFRESIGLKSVTIPYTVDSTGNNVFFKCSNLNSVTFESSPENPSRFTRIGYSCFQNCKRLASITLPESLTEIWGWAFSGSGLTGITIPASVKFIGKEVFYNAPDLNSVVFSNKSVLDSIGEKAFSGSGLKRITIPASVKFIGKEVFSGASELISVDFSDDSVLESIGNLAFLNCIKLSLIEFPANLKTIGAYAFQGCENIEEVNLPNSVEQIGNFAFLNCKKLNKVTLPDHWTWVNQSLFEGCTNLKNIHLPNSMQTIAGNCFKDSGMDSIVLPSSTCNIKEGALGNVTKVAFMGCMPPPGSIDNNVFDKVEKIYVPSCYSENFEVEPYQGKIERIPTYVIKSGDWNTYENWIDPDGKVCTAMPDLNGQHVCVGYDKEKPGESQTVTISSNVNVKTIDIYTGKSIMGKYPGSNTPMIVGFEGGAKLDIKDGGKLEVEGRIFKYNATGGLILRDKGQLVQHNSDVEAIYERKINKWEGHGNTNNCWDMISTPFEDTKFKDFVLDLKPEDYDIYEWRDCVIGSNSDEHGGASGWVSYKDEVYQSSFGEFFKNGKGYLATYKSQDYAQCTGIFKNMPGDTYVFEDNTFVHGNWNLTLFGNPMSHNLNWADFMNKEGVADGYVALDPADWTYKAYTSGEIEVGRGFFIQKTGEGRNHKLEYKYNSGVGSKSWSAESINVTVSSLKGSDNTIISLGGSENPGFFKMPNPNEEVSTIYTVGEGYRYCINSFDDDVEEIPLYFDAKDMATYTITMEPTAGIRYLHLYDRMTGVDTDMLRWGEYKFKAKSGEVGNRFVLRLAEMTDNDDANENFVYQSGNTLYINEFGTVQIVDMTGRVVMDEFVGDNSIDISSLRKSAAYIVRLINDKTVKIQKIVVL